MKKSRLLGALCATVFSFALTPIADAAYIYTYTGNNYDRVYAYQNHNIFDTSMRLELSFTTDDLITNHGGDAASFVTSFSFFDGVNLLTEADSFGTSTFDLRTDSSGNVNYWDIQFYENLEPFELGNRESIMVTRNNIYGLEEDKARSYDCIAPPFGSCTALDDYYAEVIDMKGIWTVSEVPIPPSVWLFGSGLLGLVGMARRKAA